MDSKTDSSPVDSNPFDVLRGTLKDLSDAFTATKAEITSSKKPYVLPRDDPRIVALANILESGTDDANAVSSVCHRLIVNSKQLLVTPPPPREPLPRLVDGVLLNPDGTEAETKPRLKPQEPPAPHRRQAWVDDEPTISEALIAPSTPPAVAAPKSSPPQQPVGALDAPLYCGAAPAILSAAASAQWRVVRVLFELGVDLNAREAVTGRAALHYAAAAGQAELCRDLLAAGAKADSVEGDARTPLMLAALHGHAAVVSVLLEHVRATATAAAAAASNSVGDAPGVSRLDGSDADGSSDDEAVARSPFRDVSDDDSDGPSPMDANGRVAARPKRAAAAASSAKPGMVDSAVGPSDSDSDDGAAARESGAGADGDVSDVEGAIGAAISASAARRSALRGRALLSPAEKVTAALRDAVTAVDSTGDTALHLAVAAPSLTCVELLVAAGATVDAKGAAGTRPIVTAAWQGDDPIVAALLSAHASVDTQNASGYTAAMGAVREGYLTILVRLLDAGATTHLVDDQGRDALAHAIAKGPRAAAAAAALRLRGAALPAAAAPLLPSAATVPLSKTLRDINAANDTIRVAAADAAIATGAAQMKGRLVPLRIAGQEVMEAPATDVLAAIADPNDGLTEAQRLLQRIRHERELMEAERDGADHERASRAPVGSAASGVVGDRQAERASAQQYFDAVGYGSAPGGVQMEFDAAAVRALRRPVYIDMYTAALLRKHDLTHAQWALMAFAKGLVAVAAAGQGGARAVLGGGGRVGAFGRDACKWAEDDAVAAAATGHVNALAEATSRAGTLSLSKRAEMLSVARAQYAARRRRVPYTFEPSTQKTMEASASVLRASDFLISNARPPVMHPLGLWGASDGPLSGMWCVSLSLRFAARPLLPPSAN